MGSVLAAEKYTNNRYGWHFLPHGRQGQRSPPVSEPVFWREVPAMNCNEAFVNCINSCSMHAACLRNLLVLARTRKK
jgi:hypothetical protein